MSKSTTTTINSRGKVEHTDRQIKSTEYTLLNSAWLGKVGIKAAKCVKATPNMVANTPEYLGWGVGRFITKFKDGMEQGRTVEKK